MLTQRPACAAHESRGRTALFLAQILFSLLALRLALASYEYPASSRDLQKLNHGSAGVRKLQSAAISALALPPDPGIKVVPLAEAEAVTNTVDDSGKPTSLVAEDGESFSDSATSTSSDNEGPALAAEEGQPKEDPAGSTCFWPEELLSASTWTEYVGPVNIRHDGVPSCQGVKPPNSEHVIQGHLHGRDMNSLHAYSESSGAQEDRHKRIVVWTAMFGLGNVIRGFLSGFFYGILSGRQLLRWETGSHARVMSSLCHGFECPYIDVLHYRGKLPRHTMSICHRDLSPTLWDPRPVFHSNCDYLEDFWARNDTLAQCALDTIGCSTLWCALSKAEAVLLGPPRPWLGSIIDESFVLAPALGTEPFPGTAPQQGAEQSGDPKSLRLKFDIALHIRTLYRCVETNPSGPGCKGGGLEHAVASAMFSSALRKFILGNDWHCLSRLLAFTTSLKDEAGTSRDRKPAPLFGTQEATEKLWAFLDEMSKFFVHSEEMWAPWSVDRAKALASELLEGGVNSRRKGKLSIFLATDSEVLRPLFVEFLRPFGHVVHSKDSVVHLDRGTNDERRRLPTVAEFYLLSRASIIVSFSRRMSSFTHQAAMYGNGTLISRGGNGGCRFKAEHVAEPPEH